MQEYTVSDQLLNAFEVFNTGVFGIVDTGIVKICITISITKICT